MSAKRRLSHIGRIIVRNGRMVNLTLVGFEQLTKQRIAGDEFRAGVRHIY
jgi:hypothetical protein